ncbi:MAG: hypothetical protein ABEH47_05060 [Haloferacaceae archaeon]
MSIWVDMARVATGLNVLMLAVLGAVWLRNYRQLRSKQTLGLLVFALLLLAENAFSLYYYLIDPTLSAWFSTQVPAVAWRALMLFHALETAAVAFLLWVTWD